MNTLKQIIKTNEYRVTNKEGYYNYQFVKDSILSIFQSINADTILYDTLLEEERNIDYTQRGYIYELCDKYLLELVNPKYAYPIFHLDKNLTDALSNTTPKGILTKPFARKGLILLPKTINGEKNTLVGYVFNISDDYQVDVCYLRNKLKERGAFSFKLNPESTRMLVTAYDQDVHDLFYNIFLYKQMMFEKEVVVQTQVKNNIVSKSRKQKVITPIVIGENYKTIRQETSVKSGETHTKRLHWRSGHWRKQKCGSRQNPEYKTKWIHPILINGGK